MLPKTVCLLAILLILVKSTVSITYSCNSSAVCGCSQQSATLTRIVGGEAAVTNSWGWAVSLYIGGSLCGGSIISSSWVITAAHCVAGARANQIQVYAGSNQRFTGSQIRGVQSLYVHPSYSSLTMINDIALLRLTSPLNLTDPRVKTICMPSISDTSAANQWPPDSTTVVAVGWGRLSSSGSLPTNLQQVTLEKISYTASNCRSLINNRVLQFCASLPCKDTCQGDSGGPLMAFTSSNQWVLVGLTSYGVGCALPDYAGVYTRVSALRSWILSVAGVQFNSPTSVTLQSSIIDRNSTLACSATKCLCSSTVALLLMMIIVYLNMNAN